MRREGALSRSESRPVRQENAFAEGTRLWRAVVFAEKRECRAGAIAGPARAGFSLNEMAVDLDLGFDL